MINSLHIENFAIIENIEVRFDSALNIITGETGAGKSIMLGALGLLMGNRADTKVLYQNEKKCIIEAEYHNPNKVIQEILERNDLDQDESLIVRREILPSGKTRAFVNDTPTTLKVLQELSLQLVDLNQQFDLMEIQDTAFHLNMLDAVSNVKSDLLKYRDKFKTYKSKQARLKELNAVSATALKERDFMKFQFEELASADLVAGEKKDIESELSKLNNAEDLNLLVQETQYLFKENETNISDQLVQILNKWEKMDLVDDNVDALQLKLNELINNLDESNDLAGQIGADLSADPKRLGLLNERIDLIYELEKKHNVNSVEDLQVIYADLETRLNQFSSNAAEIEALQKAIEKLEKELSIAAEKLNKKRKKSIPALEKMINAKLSHLAMTNAKIKIEITSLEDLNESGMDKVEILFAPNKGSDFLPIKKVASGGETSRLMLCMKSSVAGVLEMPSLIFDEIDTGVSGEVALKMGSVLSEMSKNHQVIVITHSPQVASYAKKHFHIYKKDDAKKTTTHVRILESKERTVEIAKMLSGDPPSISAISNAKELMGVD